MRRRSKKKFLQLVLTALFFIAGTHNFRKIHKQLHHQQKKEHDDYRYQMEGLSDRLNVLLKKKQRKQMQSAVDSVPQEDTELKALNNKSSGEKNSQVEGNNTQKHTSAYVMQAPANFDGAFVTSRVEAELMRVYGYMMRAEKNCSEVLYIGGRKIHDSFKDRTFPVCVDPKVWKPPKNRSECLVYSYGIDNDWGFDDTMSMMYQCEVHGFDANMYDAKYHERNKNLIFHKVAIGDQNSEDVTLRGKRDYLFRKKYGERELERFRSVKMHTLSSVMQQLGHKKRILDIFRIDAEGPRISYEFSVLKNLLDEGTYKCVRQITLENHYFGPFLDGSDYLVKLVRESYSLFKSLHAVGFKLVSVNIPPRTNVGSAEEFVKTLTEKNAVVPVMLWVNLNPRPCS